MWSRRALSNIPGLNLKQEYDKKNIENGLTFDDSTVILSEPAQKKYYNIFKGLSRENEEQARGFQTLAFVPVQELSEPLSSYEHKSAESLQSFF